jgi:DNA-binding transcriptional LysR family regulator
MPSARSRAPPSAWALAQPTVSNALGRLRRLTGDALFVRTGRGMEPTPHAERLAAPLRDALATLRGTLQARSQFDPAQDRRHFTLFLTDLGEAFFLPRCWRACAMRRRV